MATAKERIFGRPFDLQSGNIPEYKSFVYNNHNRGAPPSSNPLRYSGEQPLESARSNHPILPPLSGRRGTVPVAQIVDSYEELLHKGGRDVVDLPSVDAAVSRSLPDLPSWLRTQPGDSFYMTEEDRFARDRGPVTLRQGRKKGPPPPGAMARIRENEKRVQSLNDNISNRENYLKERKYEHMRERWDEYEKNAVTGSGPVYWRASHKKGHGDKTYRDLEVSNHNPVANPHQDVNPIDDYRSTAAPRRCLGYSNEFVFAKRYSPTGMAEYVPPPQPQQPPARTPVIIHP